jgi:hypothetical protein
MKEKREIRDVRATLRIPRSVFTHLILKEMGYMKFELEDLERRIRNIEKRIQSI